MTRPLLLLELVSSCIALASTDDAMPPWECHTYEAGQQELNWCATAGTQGGYEYMDSPGGSGPCAPCWCCKRKAQGSEASPTQTTTLWAAAPPPPEVATPAPVWVASEPILATPAPIMAMPVTPPPLPPLQDQMWVATAPSMDSGTDAEPTTTLKQQSKAPASTTTAAEQSSAAKGSKYTKHPIEMGGVAGDTWLAGEGGSVSGDILTVKHNSGFTLFSEFEDSWEPENIFQLKLLGEAMSFTVDLSQVGCACNIAFYLIGSPARDWSGEFSPGKNRGGQPPYYCDANQVGGQWCPEIDIMEANNHVFQATLHKCDEPSNGAYSYCDRGGCDQSTRSTPGTYGPSKRFTIDTREAFEVRTEFPEEAGVLTGMRTILRQGKKEVVLDHANCDGKYAAALSDVLTQGMSLRITYWGDTAETMSWMDSPPCGKQACNGSNAGHATIRNIVVEDLPGKPKASSQEVRSEAAPAAALEGSLQWVITDKSDALNGQVVPEEVIRDDTHFVGLLNRGVVRWKGATHFVERKSHKDCDDTSSSPCQVSLDDAPWTHMFAQKYERQDGMDGAALWSAGTMMPSFLMAAVVALALLAAAAFAAFGARRVRHRQDRRKSDSGQAQGQSSAAMARVLQGSSSSLSPAPAVEAEGGIAANGMRRVRSSQGLQSALERSGSRLGLLEANAE